MNIWVVYTPACQLFFESDTIFASSCQKRCNSHQAECVALQQGPPLGRAFGDFVEEAAVNHLGVVPSIVATWRRSGCMAGVTWPQLRSLASTGEASSPEDYMWLMSLLAYRVPVLEYCGGMLQTQQLLNFSTLCHLIVATISKNATNMQAKFRFAKLDVCWTGTCQVSRCEHAFSTIYFYVHYNEG